VAEHSRLRCAITLHKIVFFISQSRHQGRTVGEIAEHIDLCTKSVRRYLKAIEEAGYPLYDEYYAEGNGLDQKQHWKLDRNWWLKNNVI